MAELNSLFLKNLLAILTITSSILTSCNLDYKIEIKNNNINREQTPDVILNDYTTSNYDKGKKIWSLESDQARVYDLNKITRFKKINFKSFDQTETNVTFSATAKKGFGENKTKNLTLLDNVVIINDEGTVISGDQFVWNNNIKKLTSTNKVSIVKKDGSTISGIGFRADQTLGNIEFDYQVSGEINNSEEDDDNFFEGF